MQGVTIVILRSGNSMSTKLVCDFSISLVNVCLWLSNSFGPWNVLQYSFCAPCWEVFSLLKYSVEADDNALAASQAGSADPRP